MQHLTLSVKEAGTHTGIGQHTIRNAVADGSLTAIKLGKRRIRIRPSALEAWLTTLERVN
jgi:excisionase family DNA binding protein